MSERRTSRSGSVASSSIGSLGSTTSAEQVEINEVRRTSEKKMRIVGVNGCISMHLFGANFIVGAHADVDNIPLIARQAAHLAGEGVTSIVVWAPDEKYGNLAVTELQGHYPQAEITLNIYKVDNSKNAGWWQFEATQGKPGVVSRTKHFLDDK